MDPARQRADGEHFQAEECLSFLSVTATIYIRVRSDDFVG